MTDDKMLARIAALLRQAEGTDNAHEAEAFMAAAQRLATATSIDLAIARAHSATRTAAQRHTEEVPATAATAPGPPRQYHRVGDRRTAGHARRVALGSLAWRRHAAAAARHAIDLEP